jgi:hypothetical protein
MARCKPGMRRLLGLLALALLLLPAAAAAKDSGAPARVLWNSTPDGVRAGGSWDARLSILRGPGGADPGRLRPVLIVTEMASDTTRSIPTVLDVPPNTFKALVRFPRQGDYTVTVARFDPRRPAATANLGRPVSVAAAPAPPPAHDDSRPPWWLWALAAVAVVSAAAGARHLRHRARRPVDDEVTAVRRLA